MQPSETSKDDAKKNGDSSEEVRKPSPKNAAKDVVTQAEEVVAAVVENDERDSDAKGSEKEASTEACKDSSKGNATKGADAASSAGEKAEVADTESSSTADAQAEKFRLQAVAWQDKFIKLQDEWDLYRKRNAENAKQEKLQAAARIIEELIPVLDDFDRTIAYATQNGTDGLLDGVCAVQNKLAGVCTKEGVEVIDPKGEAFNALEAQAVSVVQNESEYDETVLEVFQKGYKIGIKVIRPAMVVISSGGRKREEDAEANTDGESNSNGNGESNTNKKA